MSDQDQNSNDYLGQLLDLQRQYLNNLGRMLGQPQPDETTTQTPFDNWWNQLGQNQAGDFNNLFKQLSQLGISAMQNPFEQMHQQATQTQDLNAWFNEMNRQFNDWLKQGAQANPLIEMMNQQFRQQMQAPLAASLFPWMQQPSTAPSFTTINSEILQLMQNLYSDEEKNQGERLLNSLQQYQQTMLEMNTLIAQVGIDSLSELQDKLAHQEQASLQQMYQWWMDISLQVFNQQQIGERFAKLQNKLEKLQQKLKRDHENYRQSLIKNLGLVTREEFDALQLELKKLRKQIKRLKAGKSRPDNGPGAGASGERNTAAEPDDFTRLSGVGARFNQKLHEQGIHNLQQLASLSDEMLKQLDESLQTKGRIIQDQWREQAEKILASMTSKR